MCTKLHVWIHALVFRELEEVWCGWIEGEWGVGRGMLWHKIRKVRLGPNPVEFGFYEDCSGCWTRRGECKIRG